MIVRRSPAVERPAGRQVLIAGVGNTLRGDDGFGIVALERLRAAMDGAAAAGVAFYEAGIAGVSLAQELLDGYDALIVLDAVDRGAVRGTLFVEELDVAAAGRAPASAAPSSLHQVTPADVLRLAAVMGALPRRAWLVGCQAGSWDELGAGLSEPVERSLDAAVVEVVALIDGLTER